MKKILYLVLLSFCIVLTSCEESKSVEIIGGADVPTDITVREEEEPMYVSITAEEAKKIMDSGEECIILDVREQDEYDEGHIPGAVLLPYGKVGEKAEEMIEDKNKQILVYCRSGRRSKIAAEELAKLGYTDVKEFGGIIEWPYEVEK